MSERQIAILTPEQEALIPVYQEKWQAIALSTEPINRQKAEAAIKAAYGIMGKRAPQIRFCSSPYEASLLKLESEETIVNKMEKERGNIFLRNFVFAIVTGIWQTIRMQQKIQNNPLIKLKSKLEKSALSHLKKIAKSRLPKDMQLAEIAEYFLQLSNDLLENQLDSQNSNSSAESSDVMTSPETVRAMVSQFEQSWWLPKSFIKYWVEGMLAGTVYQKAARVNWLQIEHRLTRELAQQVEEIRSLKRYPCFQPMLGAVTSILLDFCTSVLHLPIENKKWEVFASVVKECGWIFSADDICLVCDRPRSLSLDSENRLHAEGEPAIRFTDGYSVYAHHGVILPEKYGQIYPNKWQAEWLLEENNAELRRVLIQGIGYARICQDLHAVELDSLAEYTLLRIDSNVDVEPIYLLKMTCPSTGYIHAMRVPPNARSAREAIKWVNWGIDPQEFSVQS